MEGIFKLLEEKNPSTQHSITSDRNFQKWRKRPSPTNQKTRGFMTKGSKKFKKQ